jgi:hypothetical protein
MIAGELMLLAGLRGAREMYGKSYFSLGLGEKTAVDQAVMGMLGSNYNMITAEFLAAQKPPNPVGFVPPGQEEKTA